MFRYLILGCAMTFVLAFAVTSQPARAEEDGWADVTGSAYDLPPASAPEKNTRKPQVETQDEVQPLIDWQKKVETKINTTEMDQPPECLGGLCTHEPAVISFDIQRDGRISELRIKKSSGDDTVDRYAMAFINRLAPFPTIPVALQDTPYVHYDVPVYLGKRDPQK